LIIMLIPLCAFALDMNFQMNKEMNQEKRESWLVDLNPPQREAATYGDGPLLILAGAGSGKTRVIVHRIAHLVRARGVNPSHILAVTFTNKAAEEMRERVVDLLGLDSARIWVSTFHSLGAQILRRHIECFGYSSSFVIFDEADQLSLLKRVIKDQGHDPKQLSPKQVRSWVDEIKRSAMSLEEILDHPDPRAKKYLPLLRAYQERLQESNAVDFGDLLLLTYKLFEKFPEVLHEYQERFCHVLVDEYQDTNRVQYLLVRQLVGKSKNLCVVGDEDQSIYKWRGADIWNILNFEKDFPEARVALLEENYRSTQTIIEAASELIGFNQERKAKSLWTKNPVGEKVRLYTAEDEKEEARWVVEEALRMKGMGRNLFEMAVFYRTHAQSRVLEDRLRAENVPYMVYGGPRFYDRKEIKDVLAYLRFLENPGDEVSLFRIINVPLRGIGAKTISVIEDEKKRSGADWLSAISAVISGGKVKAKSAAGLLQFVDLISGLSKMTGGPLTALLAEVLERTGYRAVLEEEKSIESRARLENLEELENAVSEHLAHDPDPGLSGFLQKVSLAADIDRFDQELGRLTLMTIHSAKGLEFPVVFMVGMEQGVFPHVLSMIQDGKDEKDLSGLEEERRLCYVGMTRARESLIMSWAMARMRRGNRERSEPSLFLSEVPERFINRVAKAGGLRRPKPRAGRAKRGGEPKRVDFGDSEIVYDEGMDTGSYEQPGGREFRPGDRVFHRNHGEGMIKRLEESGERTKVVVRFAKGTKKFLARFAALEKLD